jgi:hypothetical protein
LLDNLSFEQTFEQAVQAIRLPLVPISMPDRVATQQLAGATLASVDVVLQFGSYFFLIV